MKEVKNPKKPLAYYYSITLIALLLFNIFVAPLLNRQHVEQTDYSTFMRMIAEKPSSCGIMMSETMRSI